MKEEKAPTPNQPAVHRLFTRRVRKWLLGMAIAVVLYTLIGFFLVPVLVRWQMVKQLPAATHRVAAVRQVKFNPYALSLTINGLSLNETNGEPFASWEQFHVNFQLSSLFHWAWTFDEIRLVEPKFYAVLGTNGQFNFANLLGKTNAVPKAANGTAPASLPHVIVYNLAITNGHVAFTDFTLKTPFHSSYEPINIELQNFTTMPNRNSPYALEAASDSGRSIAWRGSVSADPPASAGTLRLTGINLPRHAPYIEARAGAQVTGGTVNVSADYSFALGTNGMDLAVSNLTVSVAGLQVNDPDTREVVVSIPQYTLDGGTLDWRRRRVHVSSIQVDDPGLIVRRRADGLLNLLSLIRKPPATVASTNIAAPGLTNAGSAWTFSLADLRLQRGRVTLEDLAVPGSFRSTLSPVSLRLQHFSTETESNFQVQAEILTEAAEKIQLDAAACLAPLRASGEIRLADVEVKKYMPYGKPYFAGQIPSGKLDVTIPFSHTVTESNVHQVILSNGVVRLRDLAILSPGGGETWVKVPRFSVDGIEANLPGRTARVHAVGFDEVQITVRRETNAVLNLLSLLIPQTNRPALAPVAGSKAAPAAATAPKPWRVRVDEVAFSNGTVKAEDRTLPRPAAVEVDRLGLKVRGAEFPSNAPVDVAFSLRINQGGTVAARGVVRPYSAVVDSDIAIEALDLRGVQPWLQPHVRLTLDNAALSAVGHVVLAPTNGPGPRIHFTGGLALTNFVTSDQVLSKEFVRWSELEVSEADVRLDPNQIDIQRVRLKGFRSALIIGPDKRPNFSTILVTTGTNSAPAQTIAAVPPPSSNATNSSTPIRVGELKIEDGSLLFRDQSIQPAAAFDVKEFGGSIRGLSTAPGSTADVDVSGRIDEAAPFAVRGRVNPLSKDLWLDLTLTNQNLQLAPFTPYMEKFAGYPLTKGRLSLDLGYAIKEGRLKARNVVRIDHLTLGQRNNSPDATKLPVKLGVALLKDANGRIELDVPVEGSLRDPEFRVGPIILKVVMNLIVKAAASPFKLLGGLVGGGEELSYVDFAPGLADFQAGETNKLEKLARALAQRPALNLEIESSVDPVLDRDALARARVREDAAQLRRDERKAAGEALETGATPVRDDPDYERLLRVLAGRQFGTNLAGALLFAQTNAPSTNFVARAPARSPGLLTYVKWLFSSKAERTKMSQARRQAREDKLLFQRNPALAAVTASNLGDLLATRADVPDESLRQLRLDRARAVQNALLGFGSVTADRLLFVEPKPSAPGESKVKGDARATMTVN